MNLNNVLVTKLKQYPFACGCVVVSLISLALWQIYNTQPSELSIHSAAVSKDHVVLNDNELNGKDLVKDLEKATRADKRIKAALLDPTNLIAARTAMDQLAETHNVKIIGQPSTEISQAGRKDRPAITVFQPIQFKISLTGTQINLASFLKNLENNPIQFCRIDEATFTPEKTSEDQVSAVIVFDVLGIKK